MEELLTIYVDRFGENFPIFTMLGTPDNEVISIIQKCLDDGKPYKAEYDPDLVY